MQINLLQNKLYANRKNPVISTSRSLNVILTFDCLSEKFDSFNAIRKWHEWVAYHFATINYFMA